MSFAKVLTDIFDRNIERRFDSVDAEREAIAAAKQGDEEATVALMYAYAHTLRSGVRWYTHALPSVAKGGDREDVRSNAVMGLMAAIQAFDLEADVHDRLAAIAKQHVYETVAAHAPSAVTAFTIPQRTMSRFFAILREADGNVYEAAALAPKFRMKRETFLAVLSAVRNVESYDAADSTDDDARSGDFLSKENVRPIWDASEAEDDALLVEAAFEAVDDVEESVCRLAYGFESYGDPVPDIEIGHRLGMTRPTVQRRRSSALGKMRKALAAE
ncbi:DNA binding protein [Arthrobacter phage Kaylissa]|uniref:DNA binding protein n=1 Tax=Arthrobacter phage Kaylissa TaxID=2835951 RepID=A0AA92RUZ7_9CAUD|nr:DNA binding protein [Arthrobacter phage Kaylissa]QXO14580.1 DNA binding protein [Arthrobacter phage Kaylissa]